MRITKKFFASGVRTPRIALKFNVGRSYCYNQQIRQTHVSVHIPWTRILWTTSLFFLTATWLFSKGSTVETYFECFYRMIKSMRVALCIMLDYKISVLVFSLQKRFVEFREHAVQGIERLISSNTNDAPVFWITLKNLFARSLDKNSSNEEQYVWQGCHQRSAERLKQLALDQGGLYVKAGQSLTIMNHILPPEYCHTLEDLQDRVVHKDFTIVRQIIEEELRCPLESAFAIFDEIPIAAASLAQVHRAKLHATANEESIEVAVKVQHCDCAKIFEHDFRTIRLMCSIAGYLFPGFNFGELLENSKEILRAELDFVKEAENTTRCGEHLREYDPGGSVITPRVFADVTTSRVLVTEFVHGHKITHLKRVHGLCVRDVARVLIDVFAFQLFHTGFIHADPHPGNVLIRSHPDCRLGGGLLFSRRPRAQIVILDHGLYTTLSAEELSVWRELWLSLATHRDDEMRTTLLENFGVTDAPVFARVFLMRPYEDKDNSTGSYNPIALYRKACEYQKMMRVNRGEYQKWVLENMDRTTRMLCQLPPSYSLILRNINTIRAIHQELGSPVNRISRMTTVCFRYHTSRGEDNLRIPHFVRRVKYIFDVSGVRFWAALQEWKFFFTIFLLRFILTSEEYAELNSYPISKRACR